MKAERVTVAVPNRRSVTVIRKATRAGVTVYDVCVGENETAFSVEKQGERELAAILTEEGIRGRVIKDRLTKRAVRFLKARPLLVAGAVIATAAFSFFQSFLINTEISGNLLVNTKAVEQVLEQNGIDGFTPKYKVNVQKIRSEVSSIEGVSFASVKIKGNKLSVTIKEELPPSSAEEVSLSPVVSRVPAVITKVVAESGTPRVKVGDAVKEGDVLIDPVFTFTEGEAPSPARGEVYGVTTYKKELIIPELSVQSERTGNKVTKRVLYFFGKQVGGGGSLPFDSFDLTERTVFAPLGSAIKVVELTYFERKDETVFHDLDLEVPALIDRETREMLSSAPFYANPRGVVTAEQKKVDNIMYIMLYYTLEQRLDSLFTPE